MYTFKELTDQIQQHFIGLSDAGAREMASDYAYRYMQGTLEEGQEPIMPEQYTQEDVDGIIMTIALAGYPENKPELSLTKEERARQIVEDCEAELNAARQRRNKRLRALFEEYEEAGFTKIALGEASGLSRATIHAIIGPTQKNKRKAKRQGKYGK